MRAECRKQAFHELNAVLSPQKKQATPVHSAPSHAPLQPHVEWSGPPPHQKPARPFIPVIAGGFALLCFGIALTQVYKHCRNTPDWNPIVASEFAGDLPITNPKQLGKQVGARLTDPSWVKNSEEQKRQQLENALRALGPRGVQVLFVEDSNNVVRATIQLSEKTKQLHYTFH